jgi:catechol 2,3-dioxygenase-like lactoylglutathione lyase family enzyme
VSPTSIDRDGERVYARGMPILDHITLHVSNYARSKAFYEKALAPLGIKPMMDFGQMTGFGKGRKPDFFIGGTNAP